MKKNRLLALSLLACTLLAGCEEGTKVQNGDKPIGNVQVGSDVTLDTNLTLQNFYESLKESNGGAKAVEVLLDKLASAEYSDDVLADTSREFSVKSYHTTSSLQDEISEKFEDFTENKTYFDDDGVFDAESFKEYVEETLDYEVKDGLTSDKYIPDEALRNLLKYNYDEYIEESVKPSILINYIYLDYVTSSGKYKGQFSNQYGVKLEVLKIAQDTTKLNGAWNESLVRDVRAVTGAYLTAFSTDYSFVTFNSDNQLVVFKSEANQLSYSVYNLSDADVEKYVPSYQKANGSAAIEQLTLETTEKGNNVVATLAKEANKVADKSWTIGLDAKANGEFYEKVEEILIARQLWKIDREVVLAKNYDYKTVKYDAMTESEKSEAKGFASTYTSSNAKPLHEVAKANKITAQQAEYYSEPDYYTKSTYTNVLPSTLTSLRGTSAKNIISNLVRFGEENSKVESGQDNNFLLPVKDGLTDPVYLDVASSTYYICEVSEWYGKFYYESLLDTSKPTKSIPNYQIEAYQSGQIKPWKLNDAGTRYVEDTSAVLSYQTNASAFESVIELVQLSANNILTDAMKKEAIVDLFEKYNLEINDQDIYDYVSSQYPDFFEEE